jgi:hypothetical protein
LADAEDNSRAVIDGLKLEIAALTERIVKLDATRKFWFERERESQNTISRLTSTECNAHLALDEVKEGARLALCKAKEEAHIVLDKAKRRLALLWTKQRRRHTLLWTRRMRRRISLSTKQKWRCALRTSVLKIEDLSMMLSNPSGLLAQYLAREVG